MSLRSKAIRSWHHLALGVGMLAAAGCGNRPASEETAPRAAVDLKGSWELDVQPPADNPTFRPWLTVAIDSVSDGILHGRLQHYLVGNMGIDTNEFTHFDGQLGQGDTVRIDIRHADPSFLGLRFVGQVAGDTIRLDTLAVGPQILVGNGTQWLLVRRR
ncbi:MAG: hypothetical protein OEO20_00750 [Gemmatimonadota bacterium]|nr:hypothetical protein [Gemmatimonadota bacterium]MDH3367671.1 hypothetical protein [Gemmatimonadota bacterium]MDH3476818.1 hypothetical protein [Gemmatimonadota bacterium]MDH3571490.1 hypothetical protein [Gemmatimonadota bacterium]MDH5550861.1 hypothetical protein [Gemmatimonadota bacterium]